MNNEFKVTKSKDQTVYTLESATGGSSSTAGGTTISKSLGGVRRRGDNLLAQEADKNKVPATTPRNFVAKNAKTSGAGAHADKKKAEKQGSVKHKKPFAEQGVAEGVRDLGYDAQSLIMKLRRDVEEKRLQPTPQAVLAAARELAGDMEFAPQLLVKQVLGQGVAEVSDATLTSYLTKLDKDNLKHRMDPTKRSDTKRMKSGPNFVKAFTKLDNRKQGVAEGSNDDEYGPKAREEWLKQQAYEKEYNKKPVVSADAKIKIPTEDGITMQDIRLMAGEGKLTKKTVLQAIAVIRKQRRQQGVAEGFNGEYDDEAGMAHSNLLTTARAVMGLLKTIKDRDNLPEWGQEKIAKAEMMLVGVWDYLQSQKELGNDPQVDVAEGEKKGLYYYVNKRKKAGTSRDASSPKAPTAQAWKDAAKTAKKEDAYMESLANKLDELKKKK